MNISQNGINFIKQNEGLRLNAYLDSVKIPTIGYGNTQYEDGTKVKMGDKVTKERAELLFKYWAQDFASKVNKLVKAEVNQNQFDSLVSFSYNIGMGAFGKSTLLKKVNIKPCDPSIEDEFMRWVRGGGRVLPGLIKRRRQEWLLYSSISKPSSSPVS